MKFTTKSASVLLAILVASTVGGTIASAEVKAGDALKIESSGKVKVEGEGDTGGPDGDKDKDIEDPETDDKTTPTDPDEVDYNGEKGPIKVEAVSQLEFGKIQPIAKEIKQFSTPLKTTGGDRGALVQFADVRSEKFGYKLTAKMTEQFTTTKGEDKIKLDGLTIGYKNLIVKPEKGNTNTFGTLGKDAGGFTLGQDGNSAEVFVAGDKQGKGRYVAEFGQSKDYVAPENVIGAGVADTADKSVELTIPMKTASNMAQGDYVAKIQWALNVTP